MAKISVNGARAVARIRTESVMKEDRLWVMCSDGRVLLRGVGDHETAYSTFRDDIPEGERNYNRLCTIASLVGDRLKV